jgi:pyrimidine-nucleoside phosphorylase
MRAVDIIIKKRDQQALTRQEIEFFIQGFSTGAIPDYQAAAFAMAVLLNGMTKGETTDLTLAMAHSGEMIDLTQVVPVAVDKHSTGGVGDKTTLVVAPIVAACGLPVGKMSGRGLGFSGGTLDKMDSIPGYRTDISTDEFIKQLVEIGIVLTGQSADLAPADGKLYALRDVTGTVQSTPLIASSVMSKKIAAGAQAIVLDVKLGLGAFMPDLVSARELAELMVSIAHIAGSKAVALLSDMNQPLGIAVGNALELKEAIRTLHGNGPADLHEHCIEIAAYMLFLGEKANTVEEARQLSAEKLGDGSAWRKFYALVAAQGGDTAYIESPERLPGANLQGTITAPHSGYIKELNARTIAETVVALGGGRAKKGDQIDCGVGVEVLHKVGDQIATGEALFKVHASDAPSMAIASESLLSAFIVQKNPVPALPLFYDVITMS